MCPPVAQSLALRKLRGPAVATDGVPDGGDHPGALAGTPKATRVWPVLLVCLALSALTLLFPSTPTYDPWSWILWGREIVHLDLVTEGGPSWKPLPVLFTMPFSLLGNDAAPLAWLWIARAGGLLALAMTFRLSRRLVGSGAHGLVAGLLAVAFLLTTYQFVRDAALGNSEALLAALVLWGVERHLDGRRDHALYLGVAAGLLRPEVWPFLGVYGLWLWFAVPELRVRLVGGAALLPLLWFGPELWGSGDALRASDRATKPNPGSAAFAENPGLEVAHRFIVRTVIPLQIAAAVAVLAAAVAFVRERKQLAILALFAVAFAWIALVGGMTEAGYAGNQRYLIVTTATLCTLGGIGAGRIFAGLALAAQRCGVGPRGGLAVATAVVLVGLVALTPMIRDKYDNVSATLDELRYEASLWGELPDAIDRAGGREVLLECGSVYSGPFQTQMVAYELGLHGIEVGALGGTPAPGVAFRTRTIPDGPLVAKLTDDRFRRVAANERWQVVTAPRSGAAGKACPAAGPDAPRVDPGPQTPPQLSSVR